MDWITPEIAVGNYLEAEDTDLLRREGIASVLSLDRTIKESDAGRLGLAEVESVPLEDGPGNDPRLFQQAVEALDRLLRSTQHVLVQCHAGRSGSVIVVAGYLMRKRGLDSDEALALVASRREISVTKGVERLLDGFS